jgi:hypothetical protein
MLSAAWKYIKLLEVTVSPDPKNSYAPGHIKLVENRSEDRKCWERKQTHQRAILNFTPGPQGITLPLGVNLAPRGRMTRLGEISPKFTLGSC